MDLGRNLPKVSSYDAAVIKRGAVRDLLAGVAKDILYVQNRPVDGGTHAHNHTIH